MHFGENEITVRISNLFQNMLDFFIEKSLPIPLILYCNLDIYRPYSFHCLLVRGDGRLRENNSIKSNQVRDRSSVQEEETTLDVALCSETTQKVIKLMCVDGHIIIIMLML